MFSASYFSIYIPRIKIVFLDTDYYVRQDLSYIGTVSRIDYVPIGKKQGFKEDISSHIISAFVHFNYLSEEGIKIRKSMNDNCNKPYRYCLKSKRTSYWLLLPVINPIPDTLMNNAQIVENCRFLENKVEELTETVNELKKIIEELRPKNDNLFNRQIYLSPYYAHNNPIDWRRPICLPDMTDENEDLSTHSSMPELESITTSDDEDDF